MAISTNPAVNGGLSLDASGGGGGGGGVTGGSFVLASVDVYGRITEYAKAGVAYTVAYSNSAAKQPTNFTITRVFDSTVQSTGSIDANGYPTVIV